MRFLRFLLKMKFQEISGAELVAHEEIWNFVHMGYCTLYLFVMSQQKARAPVHVLLAVTRFDVTSSNVSVLSRIAQRI